MRTCAWLKSTKLRKDTMLAASLADSLNFAV
jgi:hypothetical protein